MRRIDQKGTTTGFEMMTPAEFDSLEEALAEIQSAINAAILTDVDYDHERSENNLAVIVMNTNNDAHGFVFDATSEPIRRQQQARLVNAIRAGIKSGAIEFKGRDELNIFSHVFSSHLMLFMIPQVVEYYVETGEFMDLMLIIEQHLYSILEHRGNPSLVFKTDYALSRARLLRLYEFDMRRQRDGVQVEDQEMMDLPLDMRMAFAGYFDKDLSDAERVREQAFIEVEKDRRWDENPFVLDHTKPETLQGLESYEAQ